MLFKAACFFRKYSEYLSRSCDATLSINLNEIMSSYQLRPLQPNNRTGKMKCTIQMAEQLGNILYLYATEVQLSVTAAMREYHSMSCRAFPVM